MQVQYSDLLSVYPIYFARAFGAKCLQSTCEMATGYSQDFNISCRLCLTNTLRLLPIFETQDGGLSQKIFTCLSIKVSEYDGLPKYICHKCECQVNMWHYFKEECELSQKKLREWQEYSQASSVFVPGSSENVDEAVYIKQEPEDEVMHVLHHINESVNFDDHVEDINNEIDHSNKAVVECYSAADNEDETSSPFTLVISGTTSVAPEESSPNDTHDIAVKNGTSVPEGRKSTEDRNASDVVCVETNNPDRAIIEVDLGDSNEATSSLSTNSIFANTKLDSAAESSLMSTESMECSEEPSIKKEPPETVKSSTPSSSSTDNLDFKKKISKSSFSEASINPSIKGEKVFYNYLSVDLPKIENDLFDENTKLCKFCNKFFQNNSNLWRHIKDKHAKENPFRCSACRKVFPGRKELTTHRVKTVSKFCRSGREPNADTSRSSIITHDEITNGKVGRYECSECNHKFGQLNAILAHVRTHSGEKPFFCYKCNKDFHLRKSALKHVSGCPGKMEGQTVIPKGKLKLLPNLTKISKGSKLKSSGKPTPIKDNSCTKCQLTLEFGTEFSSHTCKKCISCSKFIPTELLQKHFSQCFKSSAVQDVESKSEISTCSTSSVISNVSDLEAHVKTEEIDQENGSENTEKVKKKRKTPNKIKVKVDLSRQELWANNHDKDGNLILICQICHLAFSSRKSLYCHLLKHSSKAFRCKFEQCSSLMWSLRASFEAHMLKVHGVSHNELKDYLMTSAEELSGSSQDPLIPSKSKAAGKYSAVKLKCDTCFKLCSSVSSLKFHKLTHKKMTCKKCEITFPASMERAHVCLPKVKVETSNTGVEQPAQGNQPPVLPEKRPIQYTCHLCKKKFHTKKILYQHKKMHIKMKIYKCNVCENSYSDSSALQSHKELDHPNELQLPCVKIEIMETPKEVEIQPKEETKTVEKPWKCNRCSRRYSYKESLRRHMKLHRLKKPKKPIDVNNPESLYCTLCDRMFESRGSLQCHKGWHSREMNSSESSVSPLKEDSPASMEDSSANTPIVEGKSTSTSLSLSFDTFGCDICSKRFATQRNLNIHMVYHRKIKSVVVEDTNSKISAPDVNAPVTDPLTFKCEACAQTFSDFSEFTAHSNLHSNNDLSTVTADVSVEIPKVEQLHCKLCNKEYRCKKSLKYHMMGHSGEKPYKCKSCSNQYSNPNALAKHERDRHAPILRPFSCIRCKTSFILKEDLLAHREKCTH